MSSMSSPSSPISPPRAAYIPSNHTGRAHDEEAGSESVRHQDHYQPSSSTHQLKTNASSPMSLQSRISIFLNQQVVTLDVPGHKTTIQLPWFQRFVNARDQADIELPLVEHRPHPAESAPGLAELRQTPTGTSDHPARTKESPESTPIAVPSSVIEGLAGVKKRAGQLNITRKVPSPPHPVVQRRNEINEVLEPLFSNAPFILICEGNEQDALISPVRLPDALDSVSLWATLSGVARQRAWRWKRLLGPERLELVNLRIIGRHARTLGAFRGQFQIVNIAKRIEELQQIISKYEYYMNEPSNPDASEYCCYHDLELDMVMHGYEVCYWARGDDYTVPKHSCCDVQTHVDRLTELSKLKMASAWHMILAYPELAAGNDVLYDKWIYSSKDIIPPMKSALFRAVADIEFIGFRIVEWPYISFSTPSMTITVGSTVVFGLFVIVSQAIYRDWGVAYTAGAFFVALAGVLTTWIAWTSTG
ncbi:hypothetical protein BDP81DRAFT_517012 [Colletotrichum phormii]|uniref:Uncharacterized protein n=1 Tax=Colletotrichum phormii TaxID=359342 RepID=A0AAJ0EG12_9PEZI|nr:uncharacterized protein BDP81DRAFT_517012 [Colletotrichum phormii]KAK1637613.1 hypothetical protein BDP81DRAFT_517012 [Colletotrichum phormii]